jgi:DNA-binding NarL/FixJ family response regulator
VSGTEYRHCVTALTAAISRILCGEVVVDVPKAASSRRPAQADGMRRLATYLTARERQCLGYLVDGLDTTQMAVKLGVSPATVRTHVQSLLTKLGVHSRLEAASLAVRHRLLEDTPAALEGAGGQRRGRCAGWPPLH